MCVCVCVGIPALRQATGADLGSNRSSLCELRSWAHGRSYFTAMLLRERSPRYAARTHACTALRAATRILRSAGFTGCLGNVGEYLSAKRFSIDIGTNRIFYLYLE